MNKFHVPDVLVPSLTDLVALLVFRQARRLVFGYDRRRVRALDSVWTKKASVVFCLLGTEPPRMAWRHGGVPVYSSTCLIAHRVTVEALRGCNGPSVFFLFSFQLSVVLLLVVAFICVSRLLQY